jgi:hypothetical protein
MQTKIKEALDMPEQLEQLYRSDKKSFIKAFNDILPEIEDSPNAAFWKARLDYHKVKETGRKFTSYDILLVIVASLITGFLIKIPQLFDINVDKFFFYEKNTGMIILFGLSLYAFITAAKIQLKHLLIAAAVFIISGVYINLLPSTQGSHSIILVYLHLPIMLWALYGLIFIGFDLKNNPKRMDYIKYNGDLAIMGGLLMIAGGILSGITLGLFSAIDLNIEEFYFDYIGIWGLVAIPIVATFVIKVYPLIASKIAPVIANIFSPLVLITLTIYLISILVTGKDPYNDRDFLIVFNLMLLGVMAIIIFSVTETASQNRQKFNLAILLALAIVTLIVNGIALSAILYRLNEYGFSPNRVAVLGSNVLIFIHLILIMIQLYRTNFLKKETIVIENAIAKYLPVYAFWTAFVVFVLPWLFELK